MRIILFFLCLFIHPILLSQSLVINEVMASNQVTLSDEDGDFSDWIELYNSSSENIDLAGWYLSDDDAEPLKWQIEAGNIESQGFLVVFASSKDRRTQTPLHTNFKISSAGETIVLSNPDGVIVSVMPPTALGEDISFGCSTDGDTGNLTSFIESTPGFSNELGVISPVSIDEISFSVPAGFYPNAIPLELSSSFSDSEIRYTLDGSKPTENSTLYEQGITIQDRLDDEDVISLIPTGIHWEEPKTNGEKGTVVKAASFIGNQRLSSIATASYFISERIDQSYQDLPVISLSVDADSLFDFDRGIYVPGQHFTESFDTGSGNFYMTGRDWEREMTMEYFDEAHDIKFAQQVGGRIHGNGSRAHSQKSLRIYARDSYDEPYLSYPFFHDKDLQAFKRIILRNSSTDTEGTMFKDILCSDIVADMEIDYQASQIVIVFINGEYWGVQSIRERIDKYYLAANHNVDTEHLDVLAVNAEVEEGDNEKFNDLLAYVRAHDLKELEAYEYVRSQLDIDNYIDYYISELYFANIDWPLLNIRYWRPRSDSSQWRWIFYDCDFCLLSANHDQLSSFVQENNEFNTSPEWTILLFNRLIKNEDFKEEFIQRFFYHLSTTFKGDRIINKIDSLEAIYQPLVVEHMNRWNYPASINIWNEGLQEMKGFAIKRPAIMVQQLMEYIGEQYALYPNPVAQSAGVVNLDMEYTEGIDVTIRIFSSDGRIIEEFPIGNFTEGEHPKLDISRLNAGLYVVQIQYASLLFVERLLIE